MVPLTATTDKEIEKFCVHSSLLDPFMWSMYFNDESRQFRCELITNTISLRSVVRYSLDEEDQYVHVRNEYAMLFIDSHKICEYTN